MLKKFFKKKISGQSTLEWIVLLTVVIGALIVVQVYFKRGIQGRWKASVDEITDELYDPYLTDSNVTFRTAVNSKVVVTSIKDGSGFWTMREDASNTLDTRSGKKLIGGF